MVDAEQALAARPGVQAVRQRGCADRTACTPMPNSTSTRLGPRKLTSIAHDAEHELTHTVPKRPPPSSTLYPAEHACRSQIVAGTVE